MIDGRTVEVEYDETAPCILCDMPVVAASVNGTNCCPWCDMGVCRSIDGHRVDLDLDPNTGKYDTRMHYKKYHSDVMEEYS